jgi:hypothetical protein
MLTTTMQRLVDLVFQKSSLLRITLTLTTPRGLVWTLLSIVGSLILFLPIYYLIRYRSTIRKRVQQMEKRLARGLIYRDTKNYNSPNHAQYRKSLRRCLELHPEFVQQHSDDWQLTSLGEYLSTLRAVNHHLTEEEEEDGGDCWPKVLEREFEVTIGSILLRNLGPRFGAALLPMLGISKLESFMGKLTTNIASWVTAHLIVEHKNQQWDDSIEGDPDLDRAAFPFAMSEIFSFVNLNQKMNSNSTMEVSPMDSMQRGEIGYDPSFYVSNTDTGSNKEKKPEENTQDDGEGTVENDKDDSELILIPNPFIAEEHFQKAIEGMEDCIRRQEVVTATTATANADHTTTTTQYDPEDTNFDPPTPINERLLPGLHFGWGDAKCTHTKREIIRNRLFANLFTKLSYNYYLKEQRQEGELFCLQYNGQDCYYPDEFLQVLMDTGHSIEVCPRSCITTFGVAACVKEDDDSWTNIPIGFFFRTGFERFDGRPAYFVAPHGGMDLAIRGGPLVGTNETTGKPNKCDIQFYVAIEGLCGWHSNHNADVPWLIPVSTTEIYDKEQCLQAVRMAGLLAVTFNSIATEMNLPFGGYGVLGVCNDSAAYVDTAIRGETNMYPLISTGRFLAHSARRLSKLRQELTKDTVMEAAVRDARRLVTAACTLESDIHNSPSNLIGGTRRYLANNPVSYFQLTEDSKEMLTTEAKFYEEFVNWEETTSKESTTNEEKTETGRLYR